MVSDLTCCINVENSDQICLHNDTVFSLITPHGAPIHSIVLYEYLADDSGEHLCMHNFRPLNSAWHNASQQGKGDI